MLGANVSLEPLKGTDVTSFSVGDRYTRDQVRAALGLQPMSGGDWATGYTQYQGEVFVFCNIGVAGRTGHDYPNRWIDDALDWFGKTGSTPKQPMIKAMVTGTVTTHVFWRGRDRAAFIYAGIGIVNGVWGEKPVEVLWRFKAPGTQSQPAASASPTRSAAEPAAPTFRHGPAPSFGFKQFLAEDGECWLYLMALGGAVDALFPHLTPGATGRTVVKIGISSNPSRRERELNMGFPIGADARWSIRRTRKFDTARAAYEAEGVLLQRLADQGRWLSGEFAVVPDQDLVGLLGP